MWFQEPVPAEVSEALDRLLISCRYWSSTPLSTETTLSHGKPAEACVMAMSSKTLIGEATEAFYTGCVVASVLMVLVWGFCRVAHGIWRSWRFRANALKT